MFRSRNNSRRSRRSVFHDATAQVAETSCENLELRRMLSGQSVAPSDCPQSVEISIQDSINDSSGELALPFDSGVDDLARVIFIEDPAVQQDSEFEVTTVEYDNVYVPEAALQSESQTFRVEIHVDEAFESDAALFVRLGDVNSAGPLLNSQTGQELIVQDDRDPAVFLPVGSESRFNVVSEVSNATVALANQQQDGTVTVQIVASLHDQQPTVVFNDVYVPPTVTITFPVPDSVDTTGLDQILDQPDEIEFDTVRDDDLDAALVDLFGSQLTGEQTHPRLSGDSINQVAVVLPESTGAEAEGGRSGEETLIRFPIGVMDGVRDLLSNMINDQTWLSSR